MPSFICSSLPTYHFVGTPQSAIADAAIPKKQIIKNSVNKSKPKIVCGDTYVIYQFLLANAMKTKISVNSIIANPNNEWIAYPSINDCLMYLFDITITHANNVQQIHISNPCQ